MPRQHGDAGAQAYFRGARGQVGQKRKRGRHLVESGEMVLDHEHAVKAEFLCLADVVDIAAVVLAAVDGDIAAINGISVRQPGATFSQAAWKVMRKVKAGAVISYADLADRAGSAAAVRAAGSACAKNAIMLVVPCHRIVKSGGALGNYAYGINKKEWLLRHEGAL